MKLTNLPRGQHRASLGAGVSSTAIILLALGMLIPGPTSSTAAEAGDSLTVPAGVEVRPGRRVVLRAGDYDAGSFVTTRPITDAAPKSTTAIFEVEYVGFTPEAQAAFQAAVDVWSTRIASSVVIRIKATWEPLGIGVLGSAGAPFLWRGFSGSPDPNVWYPDPLADSLHGSNLGIGNAADIVASFNSRNDSWYFGTDGETPNGEYDLMTVVMHEIAHGLGFAGSAAVQFSKGSWGFEGSPMAYDQFTEDGDGELIIDTRIYPNPSVELGDALTGLFVFWAGPRAVSVNEGEQPHLYAPANWQDGSSYSHLSEEDYPAGDKDSLMTPILSPSEAIHDPGPIALCLFQDVGWTTAQDCGDLPEATVTYWVATASQASGAGGSQWRTRLSVFNRSLIDATVEIIFHGESMQSTMVTLPPGNQFVEDDIVGFLGSSGSGPIEVIANAQLIVASRTYNQDDTGTFGQYIDGDLPIEAAKTDQRRWLTMLEETNAYRTNIGFTNTGAEPAVVLVTLFDSAADQLAEYEVEIAAGANVQDNQPFSNRAGRNDITGGFASVRVLEGSGVIIYGSVIDNASGDPVTIPAKR